MDRPGKLAREVFGAHFQNPVLLAAGTAGFGRELEGVLDLDQLGGLVTKAVSRNPRKGNPSPRVAEFPGGMINAIGLANPGLDHVLVDELPWLARRMTRARVIVNVVGFTEDEYVQVVQGLEGAAGITALELNLSCPNTSKGGIEFGADCGSLTRVVERCRAVTRRPLVVKLSPALADIAGMALVARDAGADGVSLVNTLPGLIYDEEGRPRLGNGNGGISGPTLLPVGVLATLRLTERAPGFPVIGVGGIQSAADVKQYLNAGASLVAIGTAALADPRLPERVIQDLEQNG